MSFDLYAAIRRHLAESTSPDPHVIADAVVAEVPAREVRAVLGITMPDAVRKAIHEQRGTAPVPADVQAGVNGRRGVGEMVRDPWRHRRWVPGVGWKFLGDLTADDLDAQADDYDARAGQMGAKAKACCLLAQRMRAAGVATLRDLGAEGLEAAA